MEAKKTDKADLTKKTSFFFSIGLLVTLGITFMAFEWKSYDDNLVDLQGKSTNVFEELIEVPPTEQPPPPAPIIQQPQIVEVPDEEEIKEDIQLKFDVEVTEETKVEEVIVAPVEEKEDVDQIFSVVEETAEPKGGMPAFYKYISEKMKYPAQARRMGVEGRVFVEFVVNRDGSIVDVKFIKGIGAGCDEEAVRVVQSAPAWKPGKQRGKPVRQKMVIPIIFKLG
ncbi:MAG TPA: energy transducer TonB [Cyclobacteriaceae bacterium]|jgi:protein TonB|nr:energy transducer TonB [Cytophagales bacterium]HNT48962.1 energy transducer TonB [Cyclobacteriaceae bacterium]HRE67552.1 energy transducer TonB [Cyclobacteriaceae bacterium]HRF33341.1 energy transducer TonB [Cyclobacteriaceae bacterium]